MFIRVVTCFSSSITTLFSSWITVTHIKITCRGFRLFYFVLPANKQTHPACFVLPQSVVESSRGGTLPCWHHTLTQGLINLYLCPCSNRPRISPLNPNTWWLPLRLSWLIEWMPSSFSARHACVIHIGWGLRDLQSFYSPPLWTYSESSSLSTSSWYVAPFPLLGFLLTLVPGHCMFQHLQLFLSIVK